MTYYYYKAKVWKDNSGLYNVTIIKVEEDEDGETKEIVVEVKYNLKDYEVEEFLDEWEEIAKSEKTSLVVT